MERKDWRNWRVWAQALNERGSQMAVAKAFGVIVIVGILIFIAVVSIGGMAVYSKQSSFCASCKVMQTRYVGWERSTHARSVHAKADCIDCHSEPGLTGEFKAHLNGARYVMVRLTGEGGGAILRGKVYTKGCTQCHPWRDIVAKNPGHQLSHAAHMVHGLDCFQCHRDIADGLSLAGLPWARWRPAHRVTLSNNIKWLNAGCAIRQR